MTKILLVSDGFFHPPFLARRSLRQTLLTGSDYAFAQIRHLNGLVGRDLGQFQALVLTYHHKKLAPDALAALQQFVQQGGGILAVHSATASFNDQPRYFEIVGGQFSAHGPVEPFEIRPARADDEIFTGIERFTVVDELYIHDLQPDINVHFETTYQGEAVPMVWTRRVGNGRVCYVCPGHRTETMKQPQMQEILRRGLKWVLE